MDCLRLTIVVINEPQNISYKHNSLIIQFLLLLSSTIFFPYTFFFLKINILYILFRILQISLV